MLKKLALAGAMALAVTLAALAANAPTYKDPAGNNRDSVGVVCVNATTGEPESCGSANSSTITSPVGAGTSAGAVRTTQGSDSPLVTQTGAVTETAPATDTASSGLNGRLQRVAQRLTSLIALLPTSVGQKAKSASLPVTLASDDTPGAAYQISAIGYTAYSTPTDMVCISGSASKTVYVINMALRAQSTSAALQTLYFIKRSTANSGGTATNPSGVPFDSTSGAATATVSVYTAAPTTGNSAGNIYVAMIATTALTASPANMQYTLFGTATRVAWIAPVILRGTAESFCINYNGAALTSGFTAAYDITWAEQ